MCQVNSNKTSKKYTTILCFCMLKQRMIPSRHTKQSQWFGTSHSTAIITKHKVKTTPSITFYSLSHSQCKLLLHFQARTFYSFPTPIDLFETTQRERGSKLLYSSKLNKLSKANEN